MKSRIVNMEIHTFNRNSFNSRVLYNGDNSYFSYCLKPIERPPVLIHNLQTTTSPRCLHMAICHSTTCTVKTFNSCTSRLDVSQCLVVQTPMDNMSKKYAKHINDPRSLRIKATFSCEVIHASMPRTGWQSGVRSWIMRRLPAYLMKELNDTTLCNSTTCQVRP